MANPKNQISRYREAAAERQAGRCFYCGVLMCRDNPISFAASFGLGLSHVVRLSCTAEHLIARQDGGGNSVSNIAAACLHCNRTRHRLKHPPDPVAYRRMVNRSVQAGQWHRKKVFEAGLICRMNDPRGAV